MSLLHEFFNSRSDANKYLVAEQQEELENDFNKWLQSHPTPEISEEEIEKAWEKALKNVDIQEDDGAYNGFVTGYKAAIAKRAKPMSDKKIELIKDAMNEAYWSGRNNETGSEFDQLIKTTLEEFKKAQPINE